MREVVTLKLSEIIPYERNPRKNDAAVDDLAESIRQVGYRQRIVVDENNVILAGHTRLKALQKLGWKEAEVQRELDMTEEQKRKYRLLDNKVGEKSSWDFELLNWELEDLDFEGYDFNFDISEELDFDETDLDSTEEKTDASSSTTQSQYLQSSTLTTFTTTLTNGAVLSYTVAERTTTLRNPLERTTGKC